MARPRTPLPDRLAMWIARGEPDACWPWTGALDQDGYGAITVTDDDGKRTEKAHRVAFEHENGWCPPLVRHTCDNRPCCNPAHLVPGTPGDNSQDMVDRGRSLKGEANASARLTAEDVKRIRSMSGTHVELAAIFGVSDVSIRNVRERRTWKHVL